MKTVSRLISIGLLAALVGCGYTEEEWQGKQREINSLQAKLREASNRSCSATREAPAKELPKRKP